MTGPLVQVYYSGLPPLSPCGGLAVYSFIGMLLFIVWILFRSSIVVVSGLRAR
jgi:hypothetical protein